MTAAPRSFRDAVFVKTSSAQDTDRGFAMKNLSKTDISYSERPRVWFRDLLWAAFPGQSEHEIAHKASRVLDVSERQVRNWLRGNNDASWRSVAQVMAIANAESGFRKLGPKP